MLENNDDANARVGELQSGTNFSLRRLFGGEWKKACKGQPHLYGRLFREAVDRGEIKDVEFVEVPNNGRMNVWRKL